MKTEKRSEGFEFTPHPTLPSGDRGSSLPTLFRGDLKVLGLNAVPIVNTEAAPMSTPTGLSRAPAHIESAAGEPNYRGATPTPISCVPKSLFAGGMVRF